MFCAFVVRIHVQQSQSFLMLRPKYGGMVFNPGQRVKCKWYLFVVPCLSSFSVFKMKQTHQQMFTCVLLCIEHSFHYYLMIRHATTNTLFMSVLLVLRPHRVRICVPLIPKYTDLIYPNPWNVFPSTFCISPQNPKSVCLLPSST